MNYGIREKYDQYAKFGDRLAEMDKMINWEGSRSILSDLYRNDSEYGGRPNFEPILMLKVLFLQSLYDLVDESVEKELYDRVSFMT